MVDTPICHVPVPTPITQPDGVELPSIPIATDFNSALAAINAMRLILNRMSNRQPRHDGSGGGGRGGRGGNGTGDKKKPNPKPGRYNEINRTTQKLKIYNPEDREQWVEVERINSLVMRDTITGEEWIWKR